MSHDAASAAQAVAAAERERILVCDDDPRMRETIVEALAAEVFDVDTADRAVDAIQRIMHTSYRALILDLKLPGLGGLDAIAVVKRFDASLPIIVMTGHASYEVEQAARAAGIFYYLVKPFNLEELVAAVRAAIRFRDDQSPAGLSAAPVRAAFSRASQTAGCPGRDRGRAPRLPPGALAPLSVRRSRSSTSSGS